jgi:hypothetical protein
MNPVDMIRMDNVKTSFFKQILNSIEDTNRNGVLVHGKLKGIAT